MSNPQADAWNYGFAKGSANAMALDAASDPNNLGSNRYQAAVNMWTLEKVEMGFFFLAFVIVGLVLVIIGTITQVMFGSWVWSPFWIIGAVIWIIFIGLLIWKLRPTEQYVYVPAAPATWVAGGTLGVGAGVGLGVGVNLGTPTGLYAPRPMRGQFGYTETAAPALSGLADIDAKARMDALNAYNATINSAVIGANDAATNQQASEATQQNILASESQVGTQRQINANQQAYQELKQAQALAIAQGQAPGDVGTSAGAPVAPLLGGAFGRRRGGTYESDAYNNGGYADAPYNSHAYYN